VALKYSFENFNFVVSLTIPELTKSESLLSTGPSFDGYIDVGDGMSW